MDKKINMIVAADLQGCIGKENKLCWHLPDDLKRFKELTLGKTIIMGRNTFESLPKTLPGRISVVITSNKDYVAPDGVYVVYSIEEAINLAKTRLNNDVFIIGGAKIYNQMIDYVSHVYWTSVDTIVNGDTFLNKEELLRGFYPYKSVVAEGPLRYAFEEYKRIENGNS